MKTRPTVAQMRALESELRRLQIEDSTFRPLTLMAWTGGESPRKPSLASVSESALRRALFRRQVNDWRAYWKDSPNFDTLRVFFRRARADAFATFRDAFNR